MVPNSRIGRDFTQGPILPMLIRFAGPLLLANVLQQLYNTVDMIVIGQKLGSIGTVGVSNGGEIATIITFISTSFGSASQIYIAQLSGAREHHAISEAIMTSLALAVVMSLVSMGFCLALCDPLLRMINCPEEAFKQAHNYMMIVSLGLPFVFGYSTICGILRGLGESKRPLLFVAIAAVSNIVMDIFLVVVIPLEAAGTAIATIIAQLASCVAAGIFLYKKRKVLNISFSMDNLKQNGKHLKVILRIGIPMAAQSALIHCTQLICTASINTFGLVASATNSVGNRISKFVNVFTTSITAGAGAMVGQNIGARQHERVKKIVWTTLSCCLVIACILTAIAITIPTQMFRLFTTDEAVVEFGVIYMRICIVVFFLSSFQGAFVSVITGVGYAKLNFLIGVLDGVVLRLSISYGFAYLLNMGVVGFFYGNALARLGPVTIGMIYYFSGKWKTRKLLSES